MVHRNGRAAPLESSFRRPIGIAESAVLGLEVPSFGSQHDISPGLQIRSPESNPQLVEVCLPFQHVVTIEEEPRPKTLPRQHLRKPMPVVLPHFTERNGID
jgi:hypothetical protein